jgi:hypothetical protein
MPGGLINIATYGSQDLFLTGTPEITYFKVVYRRHTNFSMESIKLRFDDTVNFNKYSLITLPKSGDLIHKTYLEIILPEVYFKKSSINTTKINELTTLYDNYLNQYEIIRQFMNLNLEAYREAILIYELDNINNPSLQMINKIIEVFNNTNSNYFSSFNISDNINIIEEFMEVLNTTELSIKSPIINEYIFSKFFYNYISLLYIAENPTDDNLQNKDNLKHQLDHALKHSNFIITYFQWLLLDTERLINNEKNLNYNSAWVKRIGHSIIEYVDIYIGGELIDKHYGEWIDIWYELTAKKEMEQSYMKLIGNTPELFTFNNTTKPSTTLYVPLIFWFNKNNGLALPIISLQYHDIQIGVKLRKFSDVFYIENTGTNINLDVLYENSGFQLNCNLLADYIYLDKIERRKFAQSGHEYLIDVIQTQFDDNNIASYTTRLEFTNPCKEIIWIAQRKSLLSNPYGYNSCEWTNYGLYLNNLDNPFLDSQIFINGVKLLSKQKSGFFNYTIPYNYHSNIPSDGINCYSFSLMPEEHQPSGSCNISRLSIMQLNAELNNNMLFELSKDNLNKTTFIQESVNIKLFCISQNILRIFSGMGSLAYT